jgi:hypothetical protein
VEFFTFEIRKPEDIRCFTQPELSSGSQKLQTKNNVGAVTFYQTTCLLIYQTICLLITISIIVGQKKPKQTCKFHIFLAFAHITKLLGAITKYQTAYLLIDIFDRCLADRTKNKHAKYPQLFPGLQKSQKYNFGCHHEMPNNTSTNCQNKHVNSPPVPSHFTKKHVY